MSYPYLVRPLTQKIFFVTSHYQFIVKELKDRRKAINLGGHLIMSIFLFHVENRSVNHIIIEDQTNA